MPNRFHWVVETPLPNLVAGMKWLLGTDTSRFNRRHKLFGHLFSGRYKSLIVDGSGSGYLKSVGDHIHLNLARAKLLVADAPLKSFAWSSWPAYFFSRARNVRRGCGWIGCWASGVCPRTVRRGGNGLSGRWRNGEESAETAEVLAELIIAEELKLGRWQEADFKTRPKGGAVKVTLAARSRAETTMTVGWIAERLAMGTRGYLNHLLYRRRKLGGE